MATSTADAAPPNWLDLPLDLIRDVSSRLHAATDNARFHATCQPWRDTLPPAPRRPAFLSWLLTPPDATGHRKARCVFSSKSARRAAAATEILVRDRRWVVRADDGAAACWIITGAPAESGSPTDPLTGSAAAIPLPRPKEGEMKSWEKRAVGVVSGDGTIVVYAYGLVNTSTYHGDSLHVAILRPGNAAWTFVERKDVDIYSHYRRCYVAYHDGKIVLCHENSWWLLPTQAKYAVSGRRSGWMPREPGKRYESSYLVESRGELLWASVKVNTKYYIDTQEHGVGVMESLTDALSVSVYMLREEEGSKPEWVRIDDWSLADRVLFLGRPSSFAIDAAQLSMGSGCAYFVHKSQVYGGIWSKSPLTRCRLFRYSFKDGRSELVEQLPEDWNDEDCMWLTPQPTLAPTEEIRERLEALNGKAGGSLINN